MCLVNHTYGYIFVHIPKTGGTSVAAALSTLSTYKDLEVGGTALGESLGKEFGKRYGIRKHSTLPEIAAVVGGEALGRYTTFCAVRDPLERVRSMYSFFGKWREWMELPAYASYAREFAELRDVNDFVGSRFFAGPGVDRAFMPQAFWVSDRAGNLMVDEVARLETLEEDVRRIMRKIGVPPGTVDGLQFGRANESPRSIADGVGFTEASLAVIRERYEIDYRLFGYASDVAGPDGSTTG